MEKSVFSRSYDVFVTSLRDARTDAKVTQVELAKRLGETQSFVSKCERGERRLDVIELRAWCRALGTTLVEFSRNLERKLSAAERR